MHDGLIVRPKESYDGATPSSNSVAASNLLRLAAFTGDERYARRAEAIFAVFGDLLERAPTAFPRLLCALDFRESGPREVALAGALGDAGFEALRGAVFASPGLNRVVAHVDSAAAVPRARPAHALAVDARRSGGRLRLRAVRVPGAGDGTGRVWKVLLGRRCDDGARLRRAIPSPPRALRSSGASGAARRHSPAPRSGGSRRRAAARSKPATRRAPSSQRIHTGAHIDAIAATASGRRVRPARPRHLHLPRLRPRRSARRRRPDRPGSRGRPRARRQRLRAGAPARPPRRGRPRHGLLPLQQRRRRRARRAAGRAARERILIVDWDLHHGNGTQHTF